MLISETLVRLTEHPNSIVDGVARLVMQTLQWPVTVSICEEDVIILRRHRQLKHNCIQGLRRDAFEL